MSATRAPSAAPTAAIPVWTDGQNIYTELPGPGAARSVIRYPLTQTGLQSLLGVIRTKAKFDGANPGTTYSEEASKIEAAKQFLRSLGDTRA